MDRKKLRRRSTPHRLTGCMTCRRRRVRCDERRPLCTNCVRLSLECHYDRPQATDLPPLGTNYCSPEFAGAMSTSGCSPNIAPASASSSAGAAHGTPLQTDDWVDPNLAAWLDMNHPDILTETAMVMAPSLDGILPASLLSLPDLPTCDTERAVLVSHFRAGQVPPPVVVTFNRDWDVFCQTFADPQVVAAASHLENAVSAVTEMHHAASEARPSMQAFQYYDSASRDVEQLLGGHAFPTVTSVPRDADLQRAFATIFLLTTFEILAPPLLGSDHQPLSHLRTSRNRIIQFRHRTHNWTGVFRKVMEWIVLWESKAIWIGGWGHDSLRDAVLRDRSNAAGSLHGSASSVLSDESAGTTSLADNRSITDNAIDAIREPARSFAIETQQLMARIVTIDKWHVNRGSVDAEFEVLQKGNRIRDALLTLEARRPPVLNAIDSPGELLEVFQPAVVDGMIRELRSILANFYSYFITLHRAAFYQYPATDEVLQAVAQILKLARVEAGDGNSPDRHLQDSMLWPIFWCCLECGPSDREWILEQLRKWQGPLRENANRVAALLQKTCHRQELERQRVDARLLKRQMFGDFGFIL